MAKHLESEVVDRLDAAVNLLLSRARLERNARWGLDTLPGQEIAKPSDEKDDLVRDFPGEVAPD
jgi:hypothetical protein